MKQYYISVKPSWGPLTSPPLPVFFTVLITLSPFIALTTQNTWNADAHRCSLWCGKLKCIKHTADKNLEAGEEKREQRRVLNKANVIWSKYTFLTTHGRIYCREETEDNSKDPTKGENTRHRWDSQHYHFSHCAGSGLKRPVRCTVHFSQFLQSLHTLRETLLYLLTTTQCGSQREIHKPCAPLGFSIWARKRK